jgi:Uma2 family endonuclease
LRIDPACGGQSLDTDDGHLEGAPEPLVEVAASSVSNDLHDKQHAYRRNGVREYIVWRVQDREIDWLVLRAGRYDRLMPGADSVIRSEFFPGLCLDVAALLRGDLRGVPCQLDAGLVGDEHAGFVARLGRARHG